jgi:hypothetical protein
MSPFMIELCCMLDIKCEVCKKGFRRKRSQVLLAKRHYCSIDCQNLDKRLGKIISCFICSKKVYKKNKDLQNSQSKKYFCSIICSNQWLGTRLRSQKSPNWVNGKATYRKILQRTDCKKLCKLCQDNDERILLVHHINQDRTDNSIKNLSWLCCNCHFLIHHYKDELSRFNKLLK